LDARSAALARAVRFGGDGRVDVAPRLTPDAAPGKGATWNGPFAMADELEPPGPRDAIATDEDPVQLPRHKLPRAWLAGAGAVLALVTVSLVVRGAFHREAGELRAVGAAASPPTLPPDLPLGTSPASTQAILPTPPPPPAATGATVERPRTEEGIVGSQVSTSGAPTSAPAPPATAVPHHSARRPAPYVPSRTIRPDDIGDPFTDRRR
jgi:hypothetical protein